MLFGEVEPKSRTQSPSADSQARDNSPIPLERRVSFCELCAGVVSGPDEPRKSFMKFCETDEILTSYPLVILSENAAFGCYTAPPAGFNSASERAYFVISVR